MKVKRYISSIPLRSAEDSWKEICDLITDEDSTDIKQLEDAASVMHSLIADETLQDTPITMTGVSHRLIIYLRYRHDAIEEGKDVDEIQWNPTAGDWKMYVPCDESNFEWVRKTLGERAPRMIVHKQDERPYDKGDAKDESAKSEELEINWGVLGG